MIGMTTTAEKLVPMPALGCDGHHK